MATIPQKAILVVGPESSGTRLMTQMLLACGACGDPSHDQRLDKKIPKRMGCVVWRRSYPHGAPKVRHWPEVDIMALRLEEAGYEEIVAVIMNRNPIVRRTVRGPNFPFAKANDCIKLIPSFKYFIN